MQTRAGQHVDSAVEQLCEILTKRHDVEQRAVWVQVDKQVHIAIGRSSPRATEPNTRRLRAAYCALSKGSRHTVPQIHRVSPILTLDAGTSIDRPDAPGRNRPGMTARFMRNARPVLIRQEPYVRRRNHPLNVTSSGAIFHRRIRPSLAFAPSPALPACDPLVSF